MARVFGWVLLFFILSSSCKKDKEVIIENNTHPPDGTISNVVKENYVNKSYISVLGRKPSASELSAGIAVLNQHNLSVADRNQLLSDIFAQPGYNQRLYDMSVSTLLDNLDTAQITTFIYVFQQLLTDPQYQSQWPLILAEKIKLELLKTSVTDLNNGTISIIGLHKRCINNYMYDQVNMGTENFVVSVFQHFLYRFPTDEELLQSKQIVDGFEGIIFLQTGIVKNDFITIFFGCNNYFEGQVRDLYLKYLFREPTSVEMSDQAAVYKSSLDYKALQKVILSTDEYAGI
ncbi:MAG: hypothetical protein EPN85_08890 [Bacteroidetes bacterium]|nr:MAG: hypothetical protein EPN85_08890 [Bacteroidota bacterium]